MVGAGLDGTDGGDGDSQEKNKYFPPKYPGCTPRKELSLYSGLRRNIMVLCQSTVRSLEPRI
jgi:hypothetical protein